MKFGYARISTFTQTLNLQTDALVAERCDHIFTDEMSGSKKERPGLSQMRMMMRKGDTVIVWRLDRLGRSMKDLIELLNEFKEKEILFKSIKEGIDSSSSNGQLMIHIFASLAEFERNIVRERTLAGLASARARGRKGGRPFKLSSNKKQAALDLYDGRQHPINSICEMMDISKTTLYKYIRERLTPPQ